MKGVTNGLSGVVEVFEGAQKQGKSRLIALSVAILV